MVDSLNAEYLREIDNANRLNIDSQTELSTALSNTDVSKVSILYLLTMIREKTADATDSSQAASIKQAGQAAFDEGLSKLLSDAGGDYKKLVEKLKNIDITGMSDDQKNSIVLTVNLANQMASELATIDKLQQDLKSEGQDEKELVSKLKKEGFNLFFEHLFGTKDVDEKKIAKDGVKQKKQGQELKNAEASIASSVENLKGVFDKNSASEQARADQGKNLDQSLVNAMFSQNNFSTIF